MEQAIHDWLTELLMRLGITPQAIEVSVDSESTYQAQLNLEAADAGIMIGYHGDTIAALQLLLGAADFNQPAEVDEKVEWKRVIVNINDYRQKRQETLEKLAKDTAEKVKEGGQPIALFNLNPFERRLVHMALSADKDIVTESEGEGGDRHLIVSPAGNEQP